MKNNKLGYIIFFLLIVYSLLYPYALINDGSLIFNLVKAIGFINLTGIAYYYGKKKNIEVNYNLFLAFLLLLINSLIFKDYEINIIRIVPCIIVWNKIGNNFKHFIYIPIFFILSLISGFYTDSYLICLFPFYLLGQYKFNIKINDKILKILSFILILILSTGIFYILNHFYVSFDILNLNVLEIKKHLIFRFGYFVISSLILISLGNIFKREIKEDNYLLLISSIPLISNLFLIFIDKKFYSNFYILYALIISAIIIVLINNKYMGILIKKISNINKTILNVLIIGMFIVYLAIPKLKVNYVNEKMYTKMSDKEINDINNSFKISFVGDLIMLENQVKSGYENGQYNYDKMFEYTKKYFNDSDLTIGTLEGPVANSSYSVGNFDDGVNLYLNYPVEFAESIKKSGIDIVTLANNHMLDKDINGLKETKENLDKIGLDYIGDLNNNSKIIEKENLKIGILTYTYGSNYYEEDELIKLGIKSLIVSPYSKHFKEIKEKVKKDFNSLKKQNVDLIIVLPHMGTQFSHDTDVYQNTWNKLFEEYGADIILGNHAHAVEPVEYMNDTFIVNCPGNFANQYSGYDGDASSIVEIYVNKSSKKVISSSIIPMYTQANNDGFYRAIPIYEIMTDKELYNSLSKYEMKRIEEVHSLITKVMINEDVNINNIEKKYYYFKDGYKRGKTEKLEINDAVNSKVYNEFINSNNYCFIGDSVTEGTKNGGYGWYEPLILNFNGNVKTSAHGSYTTKMLLDEKKNEIKDCSSDLNIIAIGTNDIRYRDESICAMNEKDYIKNIDSIVKIVKNNKPNSKIILIAPWISLISDNVTPLSQEEKEILFKKYNNALNDYANENNYLYVDPNEYILNELKGTNSKYYLIDHIHPNKINGIRLYSEAVLKN